MNSNSPEHSPASPSATLGEKRLAATTQLVPWEADLLAGKFTLIGEQALELFGYPLDQWRDFEFWEGIIHPDDRAAAVQACHAALPVHDHYVLEYRMLAADGRVLWIQDIVNVVDRASDRVLLRGYFLDITSRKQTEADLTESEAAHRLLAENSTDLICRFTPEMVCSYVSPAVTPLLGYQPQQWLGRSGHDFVHPEDVAATQRVIAEMVQSRQPRAATFRLRCLDGSYRWFECQGRGIHDPMTGRLAEMVTTGRDVTDRIEAFDRLRRREAELTQAERLSTLAQLAAELAHELNQPLYAIANFADICLESLQRGAGLAHADLQRWIEAVSQQSRRAGSILRRINGFVRKGELDCTAFDLNDCVRETLSLLEANLQSSGVKLKCEFAAGALAVHADRLLLEQVLRNLVRNALEAMEESTAERRLLVRTSLSSAKEAGVELIDSGVGLSSAAEERLFEPFYTTKCGGTGLGLPFCRSTLQAHGGDIWATNAASGGASFRFALPALAAESLSPAQPLPPALMVGES
jgi:PAS domain S-box-containing protein